ncbi:unnamed protein product [Orchesella dallaii]|uniref:rhomboid protease n=1 Tax=Orchesella dallaii TaxID=48710 RepID=A0ABP1RFP6_9HEXA
MSSPNKLGRLIKSASGIRGSLKDFTNNVRNQAKVAQDGQLNGQNFRVAGWINSCWTQFGQLGKVPKSKFSAFLSKNSLDQFSSPWSTHLVRNLRRRASEQPHANREKLYQSRSDQIPSLPPVPQRLSGMDRINLIFKPFAFTALVGTSSIVACTIWQYEEYRRQVSTGRFSLSNLSIPGFGGSDQESQRRRSSVGIKFQSWWSSLTPGEKVFWPICAINGAVCLAWRVPAFTSTMINYFSCSPMGRAVCWPMLLSTFSHYSFFHLCANMFVLHSFLPAAAQIMGKEQFVALYLTSGTVASLGSHLHKVFVGSNVPSLGASGAIMGILGLVCTRMPDIQLGVIFLPGVQFTADTALKCILAIDVAGLVSGWKFMDHAAHLAGCLFGIGFSHWGKDTFWAFRDFIMTKWHRLRTSGAPS